MATLALLLALGFCAFAYYREAQRKLPVTAAVWIPTLWMLRCASRGVDAWFGRGGSTGTEAGATYEQIYLLLTALAAFVVVYQRRRRVRGVLKQNRALVLFFVYITVSVSWSPVLADSSRQLFRAFGDLAMGLILVTEASPMAAILAMVRRCMILLIPMSVVLSKYYPQLGRIQSTDWGPDMWIGVATHKNTLGQLLFLTGFVLFVELFTAVRQRKLRWSSLPAKMPLEIVYLALTLYLLNGGGAARSSTSISALLTAIILFLLMEHFRPRPRLVPAVLVTLLCVIGAAQLASDFLLGSSLREIIAEIQGKDPTLAGRTQLWRDVLELGRAHPVQGAGFAGFWTPEIKHYLRVDRHHWWGPQQAHNGYIETYLQLGVVGVALLAWVIVEGFRGATRLLAKDYDYSRLRIVLIVAAVVQNYSEAGFPRPTHLVWFAFLAVVLNPNLQLRKPPVKSKTETVGETAAA